MLNMFVKKLTSQKLVYTIKRMEYLHAIESSVMANTLCFMDDIHTVRALLCLVWLGFWPILFISFWAPFY